MCNIAIIDMGICLYSHVSLQFDIEVSPDGKLSKSHNMMELDSIHNMEYNHGNVCYDIIKKYAPDSSIGYLRILNKTGKGNIHQLVAALRFCYENKIGIVNLSLGSIDFHDFELLRECVNECTSNGMIIVAAYNNSDFFTYPAALSSVIGVETDKDLFGKSYHKTDISLLGVNIRASSRHRIKNSVKTYITPLANSFSTPFITAQIYNFIKEKKFDSLPAALSFLISRGFFNEENHMFHPRRVDWIRKALLVNIDKPQIIYSNYKNIITQITISEDDFYAHMNLNTYLEPISKSYDTVILDLRNLKSVVIKDISEISKNVVVLNDKFNIPLIAEKGYFMWTYSYYNEYWKRIPHTDDKNTAPIIAFTGYTDEKLINVLKSLQDRFISEDYNAVVITESQVGILFGFEIFSSYLSPLDQINNLYGLYKADVFLIEFKNIEFISEEVDIIVSEQTLKFSNFCCISGADKYIDELYFNIVKELL